MRFGFSKFLFHTRRTLGIALSLVFSVLSLLGYRTPAEGAGLPGAQVTGCLYASFRKIIDSERIGATQYLNLSMAGNEYEGFQLVLKSRRPQEGLQWGMTPFTGPAQAAIRTEVFRESYISVVTNGIRMNYPDALIPFTQETFSIPDGGLNNPFYIRLYAPEDTPAGEYFSTITVGGSDGSEQCIFRICVRVWAFALPVKPSCETAMGISGYSIAVKHGVDPSGPQAAQLYKKYYEMMLEHKISPYSIPLDILSSEADAYMSDERLTSFCIPYVSDDERLAALYNKVRSNPAWAAKAYFYPIDEPSSAAAYEQYAAITDRLARVCPGYNMVTPFYIYKFTDGGREYNSLVMQNGRSNIICAVSNLYDTDGFAQEVARRTATGDKSWWYVCCGPQVDYCNLFIHWEGIRHRILFWQQKERNVSGLLYWCTTYWNDVADPWSEALTTPWTGDSAFGDGSLMYNGNKIGIDGPVSSLRLEAVTDGIEDYEYLTLAQNRFGRSYTQEAIAKVTASLTDYTYSDTAFNRARYDLGCDLSAAAAP